MLYRAAKEVGGDYYDFFKISDHELGLAIADVCGKGVPAGLLMSVARSILKSIAPNNASPAVTLQALNRLLLEDLTGGSLFITMFYAVLDTRRNRLTYTSAGHNPVLCYRADQNRIEHLELKQPCLPLGLVGGDPFSRLAVEREVTLGPGDIVALYTDGVSEAMNSHGKEFGLSRLEQVILTHAGEKEAGSILANLEHEVSLFCADTPQSDDIAVVLFKMLGGREQK
jgi:sigma-B regulation protein RsbU (phosphoserine phosphatase)